jgi:hypothetical protein
MIVFTATAVLLIAAQMAALLSLLLLEREPSEPITSSRKFGFVFSSFAQKTAQRLPLPMLGLVRRNP